MMTDNLWFILFGYAVFLVLAIILYLKSKNGSIRIIVSGFTSLMGIMLGFTLLPVINWMGVIVILFNFVLLAWTFLSDEGKGSKRR